MAKGRVICQLSVVKGLTKVQRIVDIGNMPFILATKSPVE
ncbi:hypothetical protein GPAL_0347 [Glaciecola pallidula DSM 14239 = ACAM 615]|uniref:Uncharacterized protein n=1 Tax=Brumicola pallidula DSM 14239 = ACAM 615 TaxID=1121922 RepID=K6ZA24_9ALTE|nr:hypothetical protein GPAL_0347 [Glaciecola pallidula DSM 14239 = ACAM 615]